MNPKHPFYVDVGTSVVAIRCASNHDVVERYDHVLHPHTLKLAKDICDRMNKEVEICRPLRNCDVGTAEEQVERYMNFCHNHPKCTGCPCAGRMLYNQCEFAWAQLPYVATEGGAK